MSLLKPVAVALAAVLLVPAWLSAQSLAEVAAREKERRKKQQAAGQSYTEEDLAKARRAAPRIGAESEVGEATEESGEQANAETPPADGAAAAPAEKTEDELEAERVADWRKRYEEAQAEVTRLDQEIASLERALGDLSQPLYGSGRSRQLERLETAKAARTGAVQRVDDLQEEARRGRIRY